jgi:hypothetical protein
MERRTRARSTARQTRPARKLASAREYEHLVQEFAEARLLPYLDRISSSPSQRGKLGKELNDSVWRTVTLHSFEVLERFTLGLQTILGFRPGQPGSVRTGCTQSEGKPL